MVQPSLIEALEALRNEGGSGNRLVVSMGPAWFVLMGARSEPALRCEAVARAWLPDRVPLGPEQVNRLRQSGFALEGQPRLLSKTYAECAAEIAEELVALFASVYGQTGVPELALFLGDLESVDNPQLMEAMRRASKERSMEARQGVYRALIRAQLLVPVDAQGEMIQMGTLGDRPVFAVFSDWVSLRHWDPRGHLFRKAPGATFFQGLAQTDAGSVLINPQGQIGGELYRNEILAIAGAIHGLRGGR